MQLAVTEKNRENITRFLPECLKFFLEENPEVIKEIFQIYFILCRIAMKNVFLHFCENANNENE
jgi:hypothetical protein